MDSPIYVLVLRIIHVFGGVFWGGAGLFMAGFLSPAVKATGPDGGKVMGNLVTGTRWNTAIASASGLTVVSGDRGQGRCARTSCECGRRD